MGGDRKGQNVQPLKENRGQLHVNLPNQKCPQFDPKRQTLGAVQHFLHCCWQGFVWLFHSKAKWATKKYLVYCYALFFLSFVLSFIISFCLFLYFSFFILILFWFLLFSVSIACYFFIFLSFILLSENREYNYNSCYPFPIYYIYYILLYPIISYYILLYSVKL